MRRRFSVYRLLAAAGMLLASRAAQGAVGTDARPQPLPYDRTCPVIYDNDGAVESGFTDYYIMALASRGALRLKGLITTCSYAEAARTPPFQAVAPAELVRERQELVDKARRSGLRNLPDVTAGCSLSLKRPASGRIEDTAAYGSPGGRLIVREAHRATPRRPLVVIMGGQATSVVDASNSMDLARYVHEELLSALGTRTGRAAEDRGLVECQPFLGGLLKSYSCNAA